MNTTPRTALISGASSAGPALAFWLRKAGFAVTVVEKSATIRDGGYPIDVRGTALDAVRRMGILPRLRDLHISTRLLTFLDADGSEIAALEPNAIIGGVESEDVEIRRGDLANTLYDLVRDDTDFRFGDSLEPQTRHGYGVAGFSMPNDFGLHRVGLSWSTPGKGAALYAGLESKEVHGFLVFARPNPPIAAFRNPDAQRDLVAE